MDKKTMLLVSSDSEDEQLIVGILEGNDINGEVVVTKDGAEALDYMFGTGAYSGRDLSNKPQVILLDLQLPKIDGLEVLKRLRDDERTKLIPVVVLTSSEDERALNEIYLSGASSYIRKPLDSDQMAEAIRYWMVLNEPPP